MSASTLRFHLETMFVSREEHSLLDDILLAVCVFGSFSVCARSAFRAILFWKTPPHSLGSRRL